MGGLECESCSFSKKSTATLEDSRPLVHCVTVRAQEEMAFFLVLDCSFLQSSTLLPCEQLTHTPNGGQLGEPHRVFMDAIWMLQLQLALNFNQLTAVKSANHLVDLYDLFKVVERTCANPLIIWLHQYMFDQLKSTTAIIQGSRSALSRTFSSMFLRSSRPLSSCWS